MIKSFKSKEAEKLFYREYSLRLPQAIQKTAFRKLRMLDAATNFQDLRIPPSNQFEALKGERKDQYSIRVNKQWRICFHWSHGNAYEVEIVDYH